jgi:LmbE family N-acetylglucosaminyl deacetylase
MTILIVVGHPDDEVLGCGGSIAKWSDQGESVHVVIMAEGETSRNSDPVVKDSLKKTLALKKNAINSGKILGLASVSFCDYPDNRMDSLDRLDIVKSIEEKISKIQPDTVITHHCSDLNIDHRIISECVITACRPYPGQCVRRILSFEVPSSTEWQISNSSAPFQPNWFEDVSDTFDRKIEALMVYELEMREWPHPRSLKNIKYLSKVRGASVGIDMAEAFVLLRELH